MIHPVEERDALNEDVLDVLDVLDDRDVPREKGVDTCTESCCPSWVPMRILLAIVPGTSKWHQHLTSEKRNLGVIVPFLCWFPFLLIRCVLHTLRSYVECCKPKEPGQESTRPVVEQLSLNWDEHSYGYRAGVGVYASVWTRDSFFGFFAPIPERGERLRQFTDRLRKHATPVFVRGPNGYGDSETSPGKYSHVPYQFNETWYVQSILAGRAVRKSTPIVLYRDEKYGQPVMDVNAQYVIMVSEAFIISNDLEWLGEHASVIRQTLAFYELYADEAGLVHELPFGNWEDSLLFEGTRAFTNLLYLEAVGRARDLFTALGRSADADEYAEAYTRLYEPVIELVATQRDTVSVALAGLWLPDEERVEQWMGDMIAAFPDTMPPNRWPIPGPGSCTTILRLIGQSGYHRDFRWSNVGCLWAAGLLQRGFDEAGQKVLARFDRAVERFGVVHEVYDEDEKPVNQTLYASETQFSMGMGPFLLAQEIKARGGASSSGAAKAQPKNSAADAEATLRTNGVAKAAAERDAKAEAAHGEQANGAAPGGQASSNGKAVLATTARQMEHVEID